ncbi:ATP-binding protein [Spirochaetia bacterium 38H-sp]|uniref:histidine kinase n=1 Tax=Rarispira pelagica TaxID=3141764 RepID=A0ABU9UD06_9SPIR
MSAISNLIKWFYHIIIPQGKFDEEQKRRIITLHGISFLGILVLSIFTINDIFSGLPAFAIVTGSTILIVIAILAYFRISKNIDLAGTAISILMFALYAYLVIDFGDNGSAIMWIFTYPIIANFLAGVSMGSILSTVFILTLGSMLFLHPTLRDGFALGFSIRAIGSYLVVFLFSVIYERARISAHKNLDDARRNLAEAKSYTDTILGSVNEGLFLIDKNFIIQQGYSDFTETLLAEESPEGKSFLDIMRHKVDPNLYASISDYLAMWFQGKVNPTLLAEINPLERAAIIMKKDGIPEEVFYSFLFYPVNDTDGNINQLLITVKDITEEVRLARKLEAEEAKKAREMEELFQIIHVDADIMREFITDAEEELEYANKLLKDTRVANKSVFIELFQSIHAIKGNALLLGLEKVGQSLHKTEEKIKELIESNNPGWDAMLDCTLLIRQVSMEINTIKELINKIMTFQSKTLEGVDKGLLPRAIVNSAEKEAERNGKKVEIVFKNFDTARIAEKDRRHIKDILIQLVRNAVAHGIEKPEERALSNKKEKGTIEISMEKEGENTVIRIKDDGRGLDLEQIKQKALEKGIIKTDQSDSLSPSQILGCIFNPGFSTSSTADLTSGRGMGMSLVKKRVQQLKGNLKLSYKKGEGTCFSIFIPTAVTEKQPAK